MKFARSSLAALFGAVLALGLAATVKAQAAKPPPAVDVANKDASVKLPIRTVVLYSSGVGYFQHAGAVTGDADAELSFKTAQINDILKSLVVQDMGGTVGAVTYASQDPLDKQLKSFQIDIGSNPSLDELLNQLRGAAITIKTASETIAGTVLGVEKRTKPAGENKTIEVPVLNLLVDGSIRAQELPDIREVHLEDAALQKELVRALAAVAGARDQDKKPVSIHFKGNGQRTVLVGYVVETPVWKTSYRLVLNDPAAADAKPGKVDANLQGWAIVENQTDNDWEDVQLSLISGRPISFIMNLYQPLYVPRPTLVPELFASLLPPAYADAEKQLDDLALDKKEAAGERRALKRAAAPMAPMALGGVPQVAQQMAQAEQVSRDIDPLASVHSIASAAKLGELFEYTIPGVKLPRQSSAMLPIVTDAIDAQRVSIYNVSVMPRNPLNGARLKNTTGKHLLGGPITVLENGKYAGDSQITSVPPNDERLISFGVDLKMLVDTHDNGTSNAVLTGRIDRGVLYLTHKFINTVTYDADNKSDHTKTLIIEQQMQPNWNLADTADPVEKAGNLYRFENKLDAGKQLKFVVKQEHVEEQGMALTNCDADGVIALSHAGPLPQKVMDALAKAADLKRAVADTQRQIVDNQNAEKTLVQDNKRLDENLHNVGANTPVYSRFIQKLGDEETQLDNLRTEREKLNKTKDQQQHDLDDYIAHLTVVGG